MGHYFNAQPDSQSAPRQFSETVGGQTFVFCSDSSTFSRKRFDFGSRLLVESLLQNSAYLKGRVLDLGAGWGGIGIILKRHQPALSLVLAEINERALALAQRNSECNLPAADCSAPGFSLVLSDGLAQVEGSFSLIILNPPIRAGKDTCLRLFRESYAALEPGGHFAFVVQKKQGADSLRRQADELFAPSKALDLARQAGFHVYIVQKEKTD